jgi:predicted DNA-binding transcriptional regulator YafY
MARQWKIIQFVESHRNGISVADLAEKTDSLPRTIYRDLDALLDGGVPSLYRQGWEEFSLEDDGHIQGVSSSYDTH